MGQKIALENLSFCFNNQKQLFDNFACQLPEPNIYFLQGKNGTGKSTLFKIMQGELTAQSGSISFNGSTFKLGSPEHRNFAHEHISSVPQKFDQMLAPQFTFTQNLQFAQITQYPGLELLPEQPELPELLQKFSIPFDQPVEKLSGGQRQILAIIMALHKVTTLLLLDEPTAALDQENTGMVMEFLQVLQQQKNLTIIIICHDQDLLAYSKEQPIRL
jgi:ABC-type lipoprotein export system ATPase subunit